MITLVLTELILSLPSASFILEILALTISLYFRKYNIFILCLLMLSSKIIYLFSSAYQVNIFVSLFLPFMMSLLLTLKKEYHSLKNLLPSFIALFVYILAGIFLSQNTNFILSVGEKFLSQSFVITDLCLVVFLIFLIYLCFLNTFFKLDKLYIFAYFAAMIEFLLFNFFEKNDLSYFEFASFVFLISIGIESYKLAFFDGLTMVLNRRAYDKTKTLNGDVIAVCDIDFFKKVNDTYGHKAGDFILKNVARILKKYFKKVYRFGGEEFVIIFKQSDLNLCVEKLDNIRRCIEKEVFKFENKDIKITLSIGLSEVKDNKEEAFKIADERLYKAKNTGRNRVIYE